MGADLGFLDISNLVKHTWPDCNSPLSSSVGVGLVFLYLFRVPVFLYDREPETVFPGPLRRRAAQGATG